MAKLVLKAGTGPREVALGSEALSIGRRPENLLKIDDQFASGRHASIRQRDGDWVIEDLNSSNGTYVNGERIIGARPLKDGDAIAIGKLGYQFQDESASLGATTILQVPLIPQAPPKPPPKPPSPEEEFKLSLPTPPTRPVAPAESAQASRMTGTDVSMLDALVGSIRSHRDREKHEQEVQQARFREQWEKILVYAEQLKVKVGTDPRVKYFTVSRRANDIMIRYQRSASAPVEMVYLSLQHPEQKDHALTGIWYRRTGEQDRCLASADEAAMELVKEMAFLIA